MSFFKRNKKNSIQPEPLNTAQEDVVTVRLDAQESYRQIQTASAMHIGTREYQQDAVYVSETACFKKGETSKTFAVLCDGMGGMENGEEASKTVVESLSESLRQLDDYSGIPEFFYEQIDRLDQLVYEKHGNGSAGTTLTAVIIIDNHLFWTSAGDSRIYLFRKDEFVQVTRDHNYKLRLMDEVEKGRLTSEEAETNPKKEALISYIGSGQVEMVDINKEPFELQNGDIILLCSDGLTKSLSDDEIKGVIIENYGYIKETARVLPLIAFDTGAGSKDNTSVALIQYFE